MDQSLLEIWNYMLSIIEKEIDNKVSFNTWFKSLELEGIDNDIAKILVPNELTKDRLEKKYSVLIKEVISDYLDKDIKVEFTILNNENKISKEMSIKEKVEQTVQENESDSTLEKDINNINNEINNNKNQTNFLNPKYTFETFVIGNSNRFGHAASLAVAESPAKAYNPLFLYGGVGLGKTHLMHAIGHYILNVNPNTKVLYVTSEKFTNELINSIKDDKNVNFRNRYRNIDVLLIDDIQFIAGKERTQEEFFHTFNTLHESDKQIIISSDRPPKEIPTLEDRLRSRFEWGLITDLQPPDFETRIAILKKKASIEGLEIPNDVLSFIAKKIDSNIRELEGALIRVMAFSSLTNNTITTEMAEKALKDIISNSRPKQIDIPLIQKTVSKYFNIKHEEIKGKKRNRNLAYPRQIAMYLCRNLTDYSLPKIGEEFGGRDHTTVIHACDKISKDIESNSNFKNTVDELANKIKN